jgi:hypothetical protein
MYALPMTRRSVAALVVSGCVGCGGVAGETGTGGGKDRVCPEEPLDLSFGSGANKVHVDGLSAAVDRGCNVVIAGVAEGAIDLGGGAVGGAGEPFVFVGKLDPHGKHLWSKALPGGAWLSGKRVVVVDSQDGIVLGGSTSASIDLGGGALGGKFDHASQMFLLRLSPEGEHVASRLLPGNAPAEVGFAGGFGRAIRSVAIDSADAIVIAGEMIGEVDFGGTTISSKPLKIPGQPTDYKPDVFIARYDAKGSLVFAGRFGDDDYDRGPGLDVTRSGDVVLVYWTSGGSGAAEPSAGFPIVKLAPDGNVVWSRFAQGGLSSRASLSVAAAEDDGLVVGGRGAMSFEPIGTFKGAFAGRLSPDGYAQVGYQIEGGDVASVASVLPEVNGGVRAVGWFAKNLLVSGKQVATSQGGLDAFEAHLEWKADATAASAFGDAEDQAAVAEVLTPDGDRVIVGVEGVVSGEDPGLPSVDWGNRLFVRRRR